MIEFLVSRTQGLSTFNGGPTTAIDTTGATLIVVHSVFAASGAAISDSAGNTWTAQAQDTVGSAFGRVWYCVNPATSASHTFSVTGSNTLPVVQAIAFTGALEFVELVESNGSGSSRQPGSLTPAIGDLLVAFASIEVPGGSEAISSPYTQLGPTSPPYVFSFAALGGYYIADAATARNPTFSGASSQRATTHLRFAPVVVPQAAFRQPPILL